MNRPSKEVVRGLALAQETDHAVQLLTRGLESLLLRDTVDTQSHSTQQLLAQGLERLLKLTIIFQHVRQHAGYPTEREIKGKIRHDIIRAAHQVTETAASDPTFAARPAAGDDLDFVRTNPVLHLLLRALSHFGEPAGRYHNLNTVLGAQNGHIESPQAAWEAVERAARAGDSGLLTDLASFNSSTRAGAINEINRRVYAVVQRYLRFLARTWAWSAGGDPARPYSTALHCWLMLDDDKLDQPRKTPTH